MLTILVSMLFGAAVGTLLRVTFVHSLAGAIAPGVLAAVAAAVFLFRRVSGKIMPLVEEAQKHLQGGRRELGLKSLRAGLRWKAWHPLLESQLRTQIGALLYDSGDLDQALEELKHASKRPWESRAFLACVYFKKRDEDGMKRAFEDAVKVGDKDPLAWTMYAWCMLARGKRPEAAEVLKRAIAKNPADERLKNNLELVQDGKKLKVAPYGDRWQRFGLDGVGPVPTNIPKFARGYAQRPGFRQRPQRR